MTTYIEVAGRRIDVVEYVEELQDEVERLKARLAEFERDTRHIIELRDDGWTIQHPLSCRPDLFSCGYNMAARDTPELGQQPNGRFYCTVDDYMTLVVWEEVVTP
jgi:hypothetical protein